LVVVGLAAALSGQANGDELKVGDAAPDFKLPGTDGKTHKLSDYKGKQAVVVAWYPKASTPGCTMECKSLRANGEAIRAFDVAYFGASCDKPEANAKFAESLGLDFPLLSDTDTSVAEAYGLIAEGKKTSARKTFYIGKDGKILFIDGAVKTADHGADVAKKLEELGVGKK
jgi:peroxiredoxin Q/BCP